MISYTFMGTKHVVPLKLAWERGADVFDYIERFHNRRMRRRVATQDLKLSAVLKPSVETG